MGYISKFFLFVLISMTMVCRINLFAHSDEPFQFVDVAQEYNRVDSLRGIMAHAAAFGDVDNDGQLDLFVGTFADRPPERYIAGGAEGPIPNRLLLNKNGEFVLTQQDVFAWYGRGSGSVFADLNNDSWLDLYVSNNGRLGHENLLYQNIGNGRFKKLTNYGEASLHKPETSRSAGVLDFDGDGLLDLLVLGTVNKDETILFRNRGDMKFERSGAIPSSATGLGLAVGDITGNGWPDVMIGGCNRMFINQGKGNFREATELNLDWGFSREDDAPSCSVAFGDVDRDGDLDMLIGSHLKAPWKEPSPIRLFINKDSSPQKVQFEEVTEQAGLVPYPMRAPHVEIRDFNNDGWPDLYTAVAMMKEGRTYPAIYKNLRVSNGEIPKFQETALIHYPNYPYEEDYEPGDNSSAFFNKMIANRKIAYFAAAPSGDFDNDGRLDLFLASWWPELPSMLLKNETPSGHYLDIELKCQGAINHMGIGAVARAYPTGKTGNSEFMLASEEISTGYGYCSGQPAIAHLGLGDNTQCDLVISLPFEKGKVVRRNVQAGQRLTIVIDR